MIMDEQHSRTSAPRRVDRRAVVRAGVWTVPVVAVAAAAPAMATSGQGTAVLQLNWLGIYGSDYAGGKATTVESQTAVQDVWQNGKPNGGPTLTQITLVVTYQNKVDDKSPTVVNGSGWTFASVSGDQYTFLWTGVLTPGGSTPMLTWRVGLKNKSSGEVKVSAYATAASSVSPTLSSSTNL
jgi:hypothetical protein